MQFLSIHTAWPTERTEHAAFFASLTATGYTDWATPTLEMEQSTIRNKKPNAKSQLFKEMSNKNLWNMIL
jgi:hypothetical protein